jgi:hypothetical protein
MSTKRIIIRAHTIEGQRVRVSSPDQPPLPVVALYRWLDDPSRDYDTGPVIAFFAT